MRTSSSRWRIVCGIVVAALATCLGLGTCGHRVRPGTGLRGAGGSGQQDLDPAVDVRRVRRLRHRRGDHRAAGGGAEQPERDGLSQRRAVHPQRAERRGVPGAARQVRAEGVRPARERRHAAESGRLPADPRGEPDAGHQVLRVRRHAELRHRGGVDRLRRVPQRARRTGAEAGPDADGAQPQLGVPARVR